MKRGIILALGTACLMAVFAGTICAEIKGAGIEGYLNVNNASIEQFQMLPGMSKETAGNIISFREVNGPFATIEELAKVKGCTALDLENWRPYLRVDGETTLKIMQKE